MTRLAFLGPAGTFSEEAARRYNSAAEHVPMTSITAVATAVESGAADEGIAPIENSLEGSVSETLDLLIHAQQPLQIREELNLPIEHYLLARPGTDISAVEVLYVHPQTLGQCRGFIERTFPKATIDAALSNSAAVAEMMSHERSAAIGTRRAADIYGAEILAEGIQDRSPNVTRFVVLAHDDHEPTGRDKTSVALAFATEDRPGLLVAALNEFATRGINLSKIESRPSKERLGTYYFIMDVDGHRTDPLMAETLALVEAKCSFFRVIGSYPRYRED